MRSLSSAAKAIRLVVLLGSLSTILLISGCGGTTSTVSFKVLLEDGNPLPFGKIRVLCLGGDNPVFPGVLRDGVFTAQGVPYGKIQVEIETIPPQQNEEFQTNIKKIELAPEFKVEPGTYVPINTKYSSVTSSGLVYQINKSQESIEIKLDP